MSVVILVGSETGNSLDFAQRASEDFERLGIDSEVFLMDEFPLEKLISEEDSVECLIFICSTTGDGEEPGNMQKFSRFLRRSDLPQNLFNGIEFGVFGLGDSSYDKFNYVSKRIYRRMNQLGGIDIIGFRGEGDERNARGIEAGWNIWWNKLKSIMIRSKYQKGNNVYSEFDPLPPRAKLIFNNDNYKDLEQSRQNENCDLVSNTRITPENHFQDTRLLKFSLTTRNHQKFEPGDILNLKPSNDDEIVEELIKIMEWNGDLMIYGIENEKEKQNQWSFDISFPLNLKSFLKNWVDFQRIPSRSTLKTLATLCNPSITNYSQLHQEKLFELANDEGEYLEYIWRPKRNFLDILKDFQPTLKIDVSRILQVFSKIKFRQFSIANDPIIKKEKASSDDVSKWSLELLVALVKEELPRGRGIREGLCSRWLKELSCISNVTRPLDSNSKMCATISKGSLNIKNIKSKIFLFATGTGIAPLRAIIQRLKNVSDRQIYLYFGCRSVETDFYFKDEWEWINNNNSFSSSISSSISSNIDCNSSNIDCNSTSISSNINISNSCNKNNTYCSSNNNNHNNLKVFVGGSRDVIHKEKYYLDSLIKDNSSPLQSLTESDLKHNVSVFVAGHSRLNKLVQDVLNEIWMGRTVEGVKGNVKWIEWLKSQSQYQCETWS